MSKKTGYHLPTMIASNFSFGTQSAGLIRDRALKQWGWFRDLNQAFARFVDNEE